MQDVNIFRILAASKACLFISFQGQLVTDQITKKATRVFFLKKQGKNISLKKLTLDSRIISWKKILTLLKEMAFLLNKRRAISEKHVVREYQSKRAFMTHLMTEIVFCFQQESV